MQRDYYVELLAKLSKTSRNELILECLDHYRVNGIMQLTAQQLASYCELKGLIATGIQHC